MPEAYVAESPYEEQPVRVLVIAPPRDVVGGQSVQAARLVEAIGRQRGINVRFLPTPPRLPPLLSPLSRIKFVRTALNALVFQLGLIWRIRKADVLHVFTPSYFAFLWVPAPSLAIGRLFGRKTILNYRDGRAEGHLRDWRSTRPLMRLADVIVANSQYLVDVFAKFGLNARCVYNIIDPSEFRYRTRTRPRPAFLHNRGLEPLYNVACTLRAFGLIQQRYPEASLTLAHDGPCRPELERMARELGLENVRFVGCVSHQRMRQLYDEADIYLMSPDLDCMPGSVLECYASGLPIVSTRAGGIPYIVFDDKTGLLVELNDHEAMAQAAFRLLEEDGLAEHLTGGGRAELAKYDADSVAQQWTQIYRLLRDRTVS